MEMKKNILLEFILFIFFSLAVFSVCSREYCPSPDISYGKCGYEGFECFDGSCIKREMYCNSIRDCKDNSDESFCYKAFWAIHTPCPTSPRHFVRCRTSKKCIPRSWVCDGIVDCSDKEGDEYNCSILLKPKMRALQWLKKTIVPSSPTRKWGPLGHKSAVAFFLADPFFLSEDNYAREQITYELSIQLLSQINQKTIRNVSSSDLASYINALLVTCIDPRDFHGFNLVQELISRVYTSYRYDDAYLILTLCNAGGITEWRLHKAFERANWIDKQAMALMALSCVRNKANSTIGSDLINEFTSKMKEHQYRNGTVENLHNTILMMQALYAAEANADPDNFDELKALSYILENQKDDGSFGNFALTYYALPVLNCKSLINISSSHCKPVKKNEDTAIFDLINHNGPKKRVHYSIWFGFERDIEKTLALHVPATSSFYKIMEIAAEIDTTYKFEYIMKNGKPQITAISGVLDDVETEQYWSMYKLKDEKPFDLRESPADIFPENGDHIVMWYRHW